MKELDHKSIAFAATTFYPNWYPQPLESIAHTDKVRGDLALEFVGLAQGQGYRIVISDGASSPSFKDKLAKTDAVILERLSPQRSAGKRQTIQVASRLEGVKNIIRTEPEKIDVVTYAPDIAKAISKGADIAVLARNPLLFASTFPCYMYNLETRTIHIWNKLLRQAGFKTKQPLDVCFGPNAFPNRPNVIALFMEKYQSNTASQVGIRKYVNPEEMSDALYFPIVKALSLGFKVVSVEIPFRYPQTQKENEEITKGLFLTKRHSQQYQHIAEQIHFLRLLSNNPRIRAKSILKRVG